MKRTIAVLLFLLTVPLHAEDVFPPEPATLVTIVGQKTFPVPILGQAVGFHLWKARRGLTISARLGNGGGHAHADAFLMKEIGPGTTEEDEIAKIAFDLVYPFEGWVDLFTNLDLEAGTYWLVIARPPDTAHSSINWFVAQPMSMSGSCLAGSTDSMSYTFNMDAAEYRPASKFEKKFEPYGFQFEVWEMRSPNDQPCP